MESQRRNHKYRNFIYVIDKKIDGKWQVTWDFEEKMNIIINNDVVVKCGVLK